MNASENTTKSAPSPAARQNVAAVESMYQFLLWLIPVLEQFPRSQKFQLADRMQCNALDVLDALVEAAYSREKVALLRKANLGLEKLRICVRLAKDLRHLDRMHVWQPHAAHAQTAALQHTLFKGGRFGPLRSDGLPVEGPAPLQRSVSCAAAPGTTTLRTCALPTATGTPWTTVTPTRASVSPAQPKPNFAAPRRNKSRKRFVQGVAR